MLELGWLYDLLGQIDEVGEVVLAHPYKTRLIAEAQIKTDRIDAQTLAKLLRGDLIAQSHAPSAATRARKHLLRQRLFWVRLRTMLRNRMRAILDLLLQTITDVSTSLDMTEANRIGSRNPPWVV